MSYGCAVSRDILPSVSLDPDQLKVFQTFVASIDPKDASIVITNPLAAGNPIIYVTEAWQSVCGLSHEEAAGKNPKTLQGKNTDPEVIKRISAAVKKRCACKCQLINYHAGDESRPFWNMLSISPLFHQGNLMLYIANVQDYSYHMSKFLKLTPSQFCRAAEHHQAWRRAANATEVLNPLVLAKPAHYEIDPEHPIDQGSDVAAAPTMRNLLVNTHELEPEYLSDRVMDLLSFLGAAYELSDCDHGLETTTIDALLNGVACRVQVVEQDDGCSRITCKRLSGDTFEYHKIIRQLRKLVEKDETQDDRTAVSTSMDVSGP